MRQSKTKRAPRKAARRKASRASRCRVEEVLQAAESPSPELVTAEEKATLALFSLEGIGPVTLVRLKKAFGSLAEAIRQPASVVAPHLNNENSRNIYLETKDLGTLGDRLLERAENVKAHVIFPGRPEWPRQLQGTGFPPLLYVRGKLDPDVRRVAIVGSRSSDRYGLQLASFFAAVLSERGVCVVSGGALGVDAAAHTAALSEPGGTIAVLGSGTDITYPQSHGVLFERIVAQGGALVSHFPPGTPGVPQNFKIRNRVIAALSDAVVVARADGDSGSLGTAMAAGELHRPVFAIPGDVTNPLAAGCNSLLENAQARACTGLAPVADALGLDGEWPGLSSPSVRTRAVRPTVKTESPPPRLVSSQRRGEVPEELKPVWEALGTRPAQFDELVELCGLDAASLANALVRLELLGLCEERAGKVFART